MSNDTRGSHRRSNKSRPLGQRPDLELKEIWSIRSKLQIGVKTPHLAMLNLGIDSKTPGSPETAQRMNRMTDNPSGGDEPKFAFRPLMSKHGFSIRSRIAGRSFEFNSNVQRAIKTAVRGGETR